MASLSAAETYLIQIDVTPLCMSDGTMFDFSQIATDGVLKLLKRTF